MDARECFTILENAMANAIGTVVMSGAETPEDRIAVWGGFMMMITQKSKHALSLAQAGVPGTSIMTRIDEPTVGHS